MKIVIKTVKGEKMNLEFEPSVTIETVKQKIAEQKSIDVESQKLIFKGKHLSNEKSLEDLKVKENDCFILMIIKKPQPQQTTPQNQPTQPQQQQTTPQPTQNNPAPPNPFTQPLSQNQPNPTDNSLLQQNTNQNPQGQVPAEQPDPNNEIVQGHTNKESLVNEIMEMGFDRQLVEQCLAAAFYNKEVAINYCLNGIPQHILQDAQQEVEGEQGPQQLHVTPQQLQMLQQLQNSPIIQQLRTQAQTNPQVIQQFLMVMQQQQPQLYQMFQQNPQLLMALLSGNIQTVQQDGQPQPLNQQQQPQQQPQQPNQPQQPQVPQMPQMPQMPQPQQVQIDLTQEDRQNIEQLKQFGFNEYVQQESRIGNKLFARWTKPELNFDQLRIINLMKQRSKEDNPMRRVEIEKVVINCCVGEAGDKLTKAAKVLKDLTGQEPVLNLAKITIKSFSVRRGEKIACHVTVRGEKARDLLERGIKVKEYELPARAFTDHGNFGFGIKEHIDLGLRYDPYTGIYGMDFYVVLKRPGLRVQKRKRCRTKIGNAQKISKEEAQDWFKTTFDATVIQ